MISSNRVLNEITKNSIYSIGYAIYSAKQFETDISKMYGKMDIDEAFKRVKERLKIDSKGRSLTRLEKTHFKSPKRKNLVIFLQESLGYQFVSKEITPNLLKLKEQGIWFDKLYSNGTRSIRGIAGVVSGNFSIPGKGIVKRNKSQKDYFTFSKLLKPLGYEISFIYGGESRFDNMRGWFLGNGFDKVIDDSVITKYSYKGNWGVCDGEVVEYADGYFKKLYKKNKPFASIIFSTSNHTPFDFPKEKIELVKGVKEKSVENAIKYADYAIGELIELAKKSGYYKDTVFVIVADHNVRVYGDDVVPVNMFHIPGLILGGGVKPMIYDKLSTQPDILATVLDLLGKDFKYPIMGHTIFSDKKQELSLMQFNNYYALRVKDKVAVLKDDKSTSTYIYHDKHLKRIKSDKELERDILAFVTVLNYLYQNRVYK
jgi:phosphoglycerol transferase MdoB-like AlkP superfamily enzyme